jgi:U32 family peptidase
MQKNIEIMAPAGSFESLRAAIDAGANSVYFGIEQLNMRSRSANNFTTKDLKEIVKICKENKVKTYLALNTVMYDHDMALMQKICNTAKESNISAVILSDIAALNYARSIGLEVHMSTQANITNIESVKFYSQYADVIVLARELTLKQIQSITNQIKEEQIKGPGGNLIQIEIFVHGALCVAISGKCYMSIATYNSSANRGACLQNCRRSYKLIDEETGDELRVENKYIMSPKDLCTIGFIDKILDADVSVLKIEGRGRSPDYVFKVVKAYKEAVESHQNNTYTKEKIEAWTKELETVFNRGFWHGGYYLGKQLGEWSGVYGSKATKEKTFIGVASNYYPKAKVAQFELEAGEIKVGDEILITGPTTGAYFTTAIKLDKEGTLKSATKKSTITIPVDKKIRKNDKLFVIKPTKKEN